MTIKFNEYRKDLLFVPLGGCNEIGINVNLYHYDGKWIMVDCGSGFADDFLPGVDMVIADMEFILERKKDLLAIILTHAHEDHLGALQYIAKDITCPIYATKFTANFLKTRLAENGVGKKVLIKEVTPGSRINLDPFIIDLVGITHSAPEMQGLMIRTPTANVLHTGDWKFDPSPVVGPVSDENMLKKFGDEGIAALICDSTNVFNKESSGSEGELCQSLLDVVSGCPGLVVTTTFASNLARLEILINVGKKLGRRVILSGRSMHRMFKVAQDSGYLLDVDNIIDEKDVNRHKRNEILVIATGCQGEPLASVSKMSTLTHNNLKLIKGDTVVFSSKIIPGNEKKIFKMFNQFVRQGIDVITERDHFVHVSGHPGLKELKQMYDLTRPLAVIPVHGEPVHLHEHAKFAKSQGIKNTLEIQNGSVVKIDSSSSTIIGNVHSGYFAVDGNYLLPAQSSVFQNRRRIRESGIVVASIVFDKRGQLVASPVIDFPGCLDSQEDHLLIDGILHELKVLLSQQLVDKISRMKDDEVESAIKSLIKRVLKSEIGKQPKIIVNLIRIKS